MKKAKEVMNEFMRNLRNMKQYQGIDIANPSTYDFNREIVQKAFSLEKNIVSTQEGKETNKLLEMYDETER